MTIKIELKMSLLENVVLLNQLKSFKNLLYKVWLYQEDQDFECK